MNKFSVWMGSLAWCLCSCSQPSKYDVAQAVFPQVVDFTCETTDTPLSALFSSYRLVQLETNDSCLVGGERTKIVKREGVYYVRSVDRMMKGDNICLFDSDGRFLRKFERLGQGPEEYPSMTDFDVVNRGGGAEIWVSTYGGIKLYDAQTFAYKHTVPVPDVYVNHFKYVSDSAIVLVDNGDMPYRVCDINGRMRRPSLPKDMANSLNYVNQFTEYQGRALYTYGSTQEALVYDPQLDSLYLQSVVPARDDLATATLARKYYDEYGGWDGLDKMHSEYGQLFTRVSGNQAIIMMYRPVNGGETTLTFIDGEKYKTVGVSEEGPSLKNDITDGEYLTFLFTLEACDSDDGFLFYIGDERYWDNKEIMEEENPLLLDVAGLSL